MRDRVKTLTVAFLLIPGLGSAQTPAAQPDQTPMPASSLTGSVDVGGLFTATDGDQARYERYRDMRNGAYSSFSLNRVGRAYLFDANAFHVGYRDQRYGATLLAPKTTFAFQFASIPLNYSYLTRTPYVRNGSTLRLDDSAQAAVQGPTNATNDGTAVGVPCAPGAPPAACGNAAQAAQALANRSIYNSLASQFDLRHRRDTTAFNIVYNATRELDVDTRFTSAARAGAQPWGASFAFNNAVEIPLPLDQRTNDLTVGASWARPNAMFRLGWDGSWFANDIPSLVWDNPIRITDFTNGLAPPSGPYDPSGYSNGNGSAQGRMALPPGNTMHVVSATGLYKLPRRTTLNGTVQLTSQTQDQALIPWTINPVINAPAVFAAFPGLVDLPRPTAQAEAKGVNTLINLTSRPTRRVGFTVRYRYNERDVQTPAFDAREYVRVDAVPTAIEEGLSHQFDTFRHTVDANLSFTPSMRLGTLRVGYGHEAVERHGRGFSDVGENIFRVSYDAFANQYFSVRGSIDASRRRGEGFVDAQSGNDEDDAVLGPGGTQPTLRYYDEADRNRVRGSILLTVIPHDMVDLFVQTGAGRDTYMADDFAPVSRPGELFGLLESTNTSWNVGLDVHPTMMLAAGVRYGRDTYGSFQRSRNANPPPDPSWTDPARDWTLDNDDRINNASAYLDLLEPFRNTNIRFGYDYSDSSNRFVHGGPRIAALASLNQFIALPDVENRWHRASVDARYQFTRKAGVGAGYYFEKLDVVDFNTIDSNGPVGLTPATGEPRIDYLGGLVTGYGNRPYTGHTGYVRLLYRF